MKELGVEWGFRALELRAQVLVHALGLRRGREMCRVRTMTADCTHELYGSRRQLL